MAEIAVPSRREYPAEDIAVLVGGDVVSPGIVKLRLGSTALQAIACVGGFIAPAHARVLTVTKSSGQVVRLVLRKRNTGGAGLRKVWYDTEKGDSGSDYVVEAGDHIHVPRTL